MRLVEPWIAMKKENEHTLSYAWRFGRNVTQWQNLVCKVYENKEGMKNPTLNSRYNRFSEEDIERVPDTIQCVS